MAKKRKAFLHVGLDDGHGDVLEAALVTHAHALLELGVKHPAKSREELLRAVVDVSGTHADWGYTAEETDGAWAQVCHRARKGRDTVVLSLPLLAAADDDQVSRVVGGLDGLELHVVLTAHAPDAWTSPGDPAHDLAGVLERWQGAVREPERVHVLVTSTPTETWRAFGRVAGFGTTSLGVDHLPLPVRTPTPAGALHHDVLEKLGTGWAELLLAAEIDLVGDPEDLVPSDGEGVAAFDATATEQALMSSRREVDRLARRNEALQQRLDTLERKRAKLKRRLSEAS